jgi:hypothetical protein
MAATASLNDLSLDAVAAIADKLTNVDLAHLMASCRALREHIAENHTLWSARFRQDWPKWCARQSAAHGASWRAAYTSAHDAAVQLCTHAPDSNYWNRQPNTDAVSTAHVLLAPMAGGARFALCAAHDERVWWASAAGRVVARTQQGHTAVIKALTPIPGAHSPRCASVEIGRPQRA